MRNNDIILNEELNKINSLMFYDRSLTLNEQTVYGDIYMRNQFSTRQGAEQYYEDLHSVVDDIVAN